MKNETRKKQELPRISWLYQRLNTGFSRFTLLALLLILCVSMNTIHIPLASESELPTDSALIADRLENGLTYYVRKNDYPYTGKAYLRLVVNVGMIDETDQQKGIAHLIEHIVGKETENYSKDEIHHYLESLGVKWGRDENAYTAAEETVYMMDIPLDASDTLEKCLAILSDMAFRAILSDEIIDGEREIIVDELNMRRSSDKRQAREMLQRIGEGTPYATLIDTDREITNIEECSPDIVRSSYQQWYRPEKMGLIAVGDFDPQEAATLIKKHFGHIPSTPSSFARPEIKIQTPPGTKFLCISDPEQPYTKIEILHFPQLDEGDSLENKKRYLMESIIKSIIGERFSDLADQDSSSFIDAWSSYDTLLSDTFCSIAGAIVKEGEAPNALYQLLQEVKRVQEHRFLHSEFERAKSYLLARLDRRINEKDKIAADSFIDRYHSHYLLGGSTPDLYEEILQKRRIAGQITLDEVNEYAGKLFPEDSRLVITSTPQKEGADLLSEEILQVEVNKVDRSKTEQLADLACDEPLIKNLPNPGEIDAVRHHQQENITEFLLNNGMKIYFKPTTLKHDEVLIHAFAINGLRDTDLEKRATAKFVNFFYEECGLGRFDLQALKKILNGKSVALNVNIGNYTTEIDASAASEDLEDAFQFVHLLFTDPGYDRNAFERAKKKTTELLRHQESSPGYIFAREMMEALTDNNPEFKGLTADDIKQVDYETCVSIHQDKYANPADFSFVVVGSTTEDRVKQLAERYLASIPQKGPKKERYDYPPVPFPPGIKRKNIYAGKETGTKSILTFETPVGDDGRERTQAQWCCNLLEKRLNKVLRFEMGKTYVQTCEFVPTALPGLHPGIPNKITVSMTGSADALPILEKALIEQIRDLQENGPTKSELNSLQKQVLMDFANMQQTNRYWISAIASKIKWNGDLNGRSHCQEVEQFSIETAREQFCRLFDTDHYLAMSLYPKKEE